MWGILKLDQIFFAMKKVQFSTFGIGCVKTPVKNLGFVSHHNCASYKITLFFMKSINSYIKTHDSESRGQEEAAIIRETKITQPLSELFTRKTANKIANALAKLP